MTILGVSAYYHDSAACLVRGGEIVAAAPEERERGHLPGHALEKKPLSG